MPQLFLLPLAITFAVATPAPELPTLVPTADSPVCEAGARYVGAGTVISEGAEAVEQAKARAHRHADIFCGNQGAGTAVILSLETSTSGGVTTAVAHYACEADC